MLKLNPYPLWWLLFFLNVRSADEEVKTLVVHCCSERKWCSCHRQQYGSSSKTKPTTTTWPKIPLLEIYPKELRVGSEKSICTLTFTKAKQGSGEVSAGRWTHNAVHAYSRVLLSLEKKGNMVHGEPRGQAAKGNKPSQRTDTYGFPYMRHLRVKFTGTATRERLPGAGVRGNRTICSVDKNFTRSKWKDSGNLFAETWGT